MNTRIRLTLTTIAALFSTSAFAAPPVLDQSSPADPSATFTYAVGGPSVQVLSQTLTVGLSGRLAEVRVPIGCESGQVILQITDVDTSTGVPGGLPGSSVLAERRYRANLFPEVVTADFQSLSLGGRVGVTVGDRIAIVLSNPTGSCGVQPGPAGPVVGDPYAGGTGWAEDTINVSPVPLSTGTGTDDLPFQTFVRLTGRP